MPRQPRQNRSRATVQAIIDAGFICLAEYGIEGMTSNRLAKCAGVGVGSFYEYFSNRDDLLNAMHQQVVADITAMLGPLTPELVSLSVRDMVTRLMHELRLLLERNDRRYLGYVKYASHFPPGAYLEPATRLLTQLLMQYILRHPELVRLKNLQVMAFIMITGGIATLVRHLSEPQPSVSFDELTAGLSNMIAYYVEGELAHASR